MSKQTINIGASPNDGTGTPLRTSFDYTNQNFTELYTALGGGVGLPGATTQVIFNDGGTNLAGDAGLVYNKTTDTLTAGNATITGAATVGTTLGVTGQSTLTGSVGIGNAPLAVTRLYVRTAASTDRGFASDNGLNADFVVQYASGLTTIGAELNVPFAFKTNNIERMRLTGGNLSLANGNVVMTTSGTGIDFSAVTGGTGTATANVLNDYEEGTFTPTIIGATTAGVGTYTTQAGYYTKVGNLVTASVFLGWTAHTGTGNMYFAGLPFAANSSASYHSAASISYVNNIALTASNVLTLFINPGASSLEASQYPVGGGGVTTVPVDVSGNIIYTVTYRV